MRVGVRVGLVVFARDVKGNRFHRTIDHGS